KLLEQLAYLLRRHPDAGIRHGQRDPLAADCRGRTSIVMVPRSVNLLALLKRFNSACRSRIWSACIVPVAASQETATWFAFFAASGSMVLTTSSISGASANDERAGSIRPASI